MSTPVEISADDSGCEKLAPRGDRVRGEALRRSLIYNRLTWIPGSFFSVATTGLAAVELGKYLGATDRVFGLLLSVAPWVATVFQLPGSVTAQWLGRRRAIYVPAVLANRALFIVVGLLPWIAPRGVAWPAMAMVGLVFVADCLQQFGMQAWVNWVADLVPARIFGKYFARCNRLGVAVNAITAVSIAVMLDVSRQDWLARWMEPMTRGRDIPPLIILVSAVFIAAGLVGMLDPLGLLKVDEPKMRSVPAEGLLTRLRRPLRDGMFLRYMAYWCSWNAAVGFCSWLWWLNLLDFFEREARLGRHHWWDDYKYVAATLILTVAYAMGQFIGYPIWGRAIDRFGRKPVLFISSTINTLNFFTWIFITPAIFPWLFVTHCCSGIIGGGQDLASFNMMLHFNRRGGAGYQAIGAIAFSLAAAAGALVASNLGGFLQARDWHYTIFAGTGWAYTVNRYAPLILIGIALKYAADFFVLPLMRDFHDRPVSHALRFVVGDAYGSARRIARLWR